MNFQERLGHTFTNPALLAAALIHRSFAVENEGIADNERFEFLGDAVLQLAVTEYLFENYPDLAEGELAKARASSVNREALALVANRLGLSAAVQVGRGEELSGGRKKDSILADAMEAVLAAVYLDGGWEVARRVILSHWTELVDQVAVRPGSSDFKTRLQEVLAAMGRKPLYRVDDVGPDHDKTFSASVSVNGDVLGQGNGGSKKEAEQQAARAALHRLGS